MPDYQYSPPEDEDEATDTEALPPVKLSSTPSAVQAPGGRGGQSMLDDVASDLALWIDQTATNVALAFAPGRAPFSAKVSEEQKLAFYKSRIFNADGSPNTAGRNQEIARLGAEGFAAVYQAVLRRYPELKPPPQPQIEVPEQWPGAPGPGMPPGPPPGPPMPPPGMPPPPPGPPGSPPGPMMPPPGPPGPPMMPPGMR